jgi:hypothetical protein
MEHGGASRSLMEIVYILGDDGYLKDVLKFPKSDMRLVRLGVTNIASSFVVEPQNFGWISLPRLWSGDLFNRDTLPKTPAAAERAETAFGADAGS